MTDLCKEFNKEVLTKVISRYSQGVTSNPCILCNQRIKFRALITASRTAGLTIDFIATEHYAQTEFNAASKRYYFKKSVDTLKDQTCF